jgi:hypothetical protein
VQYVVMPDKLMVESFTARQVDALSHNRQLNHDDRMFVKVLKKGINISRKHTEVFLQDGKLSIGVTIDEGKVKKELIAAWDKAGYRLLPEQIEIR